MSNVEYIYSYVSVEENLLYVHVVMNGVTQTKALGVSKAGMPMVIILQKCVGIGNARDAKRRCDVTP